jgi:hypothetical protein
MFDVVGNIDRYIIMNKLIFLALLLTVALTAPAADKMDSVPVGFRLSRAILPPITPVSTPAILTSRTPIVLFTTSLSNRSMALTTKTQSLSGSTEDQDAALSSVLRNPCRIFTRNWTLLP